LFYFPFADELPQASVKDNPVSGAGFDLLDKDPKDPSLL
jgi:hypothetical protein